MYLNNLIDAVLTSCILHIQIYQIQAATGQGGTQQVYIAAAAPDQTQQQAQQTQAAQPTQQTQATDTELSQSADQQQSQ
jgi:hypothetical protein